MKNDLTTGAWQHNIGCPISITLLSTSDEVATQTLEKVPQVLPSATIATNSFMLSTRSRKINSASEQKPTAGRKLVVRSQLVPETWMEGGAPRSSRACSQNLRLASLRCSKQWLKSNKQA